MSERDDDPGIPTLTQRAPARHAPPVLTETADDTPPWDTPYPGRPVGARGDLAQQVPSAWPERDTSANARTTQAPAQPSSHSASGVRDVPSDAVLRAALQADIEDAVQDAMDEALHLVRARLEARLPEIVANAVRRTRVG